MEVPNFTTLRFIQKLILGERMDGCVCQVRRIRRVGIPMPEGLFVTPIIHVWNIAPACPFSEHNSSTGNSNKSNMMRQLARYFKFDDTKKLLHNAR